MGRPMVYSPRGGRRLMSDYPFKVGDLVEVKTSSWTAGRNQTMQGVIVHVRDGGFFNVLIEGNLKLIHRNYIVTPRIKAVKMTGGVK